MDIFSCMWITQWYKNVQQNETQKVYFGNKNVQQNETQKVYFGNIASNILTACCHNKSLDDINGQKKDSITIVSESKEHNRIAALTCLKKVIEEAEKKSVFQNTRRYGLEWRLLHNFGLALFSVSLQKISLILLS